MSNKAHIKIIRALQDNYFYLIHRNGSSSAIVVDPSEAMPILHALNENSLSMVAILNTHHHHDHVGGNATLLEKFPNAQVLCSEFDFQRIPGATHGVKDGEVITIDQLSLKCILIPGHTHGQIAYYLESEAAVFVGDTLFSMGCGRLFEGTPAEMLSSLRRLMSLPDQTRVYCGHEYTDKNAKFAQAVDPLNTLIQKRANQVAKALSDGTIPPVPTMADEKLINPFLRPENNAIRTSLGFSSNVSDVDVFTELRTRRNSF